MKILPILTGLAVAFGVGLCPRGNAAIFSSFGPGEFEFDTNTAEFHYDWVSPDQLGWAYRFNSGAGSAGLPDLEVKAALFSATGDPATFQMGIWSAEPVNFPGTLLGGATFTTSQTLSTDPGNLLTGIIPEVTLAPDTHYFISFMYESGGQANWHWSQTTLGHGAVFEDGSWRNDFVNGEIAAFSITPVPEPGEYALFAAFGLLGFAAYRQYTLRRQNG